MATGDCNLDQWMTSALYAMNFATANWPVFCAYVEAITGLSVTIDRETMLHHAEHLIGLVDPQRMPAE